MSFDIDVFFERSRLPSLTDWTDAISQAGFPVSFPYAVDLSKHSGFLPAIFGDDESGFELFLSDLAEMEDLQGETKLRASDADAILNFVCHGTSECLTAIAAAAVLARMTGGVFFDPQGGGFLIADEAMSYARLQLEEARNKEIEGRTRHRKLSPPEWTEVFEQALRRVHADYRLSQEYRKRLVECIREDATGLFLSQNCVKINDTYRHCFAVLLTCTKLSGSLFSPFVLGSRFDHNSTIANAYNRDYRAGQKWTVAPREWHSEYGETLRRTLPWVETTARSAELFLFPLYAGRLSRGADHLASLFEDSRSFIDRWKITAESLKEPVKKCGLVTTFAEAFRLNSPPEDWNEGLVTYFNAVRLADAFGFSGAALLKYRQESINGCDDIAQGSPKYMSIPDDIRHAAIFARYVDDFLAVRNELPGMIGIVNRVKEMLSQFSPELTTRKKGRWWFW